MLSLTLGAAMVCAGARAQTTIPKSQGTTLAGTAVALPDALKGKAGILVVGFSHASQGQVSTWTRLLEADYGKSNDITYFAIPMLAGAPKMVRGIIRKSMASSVPFEQRPHFLPITEGEPAWRAAAHYDKPDDAYVLLVDSAGTVRWQTEGEATDMAYAEMKKNLRVVTAQVFVP
jgi:hypothetical protein